MTPTAWHRTGFSISALVVGVLAGCASAPERRVPEIDVATPDAWQAKTLSSEPGPVDWWDNFDDGLLGDLVEEALRNNYDIRGAAARVDAAVAVSRAAGADRLPQLSAGASAARARNNIIGIPIPGAGDVITTRNNSFGLSLDMAWEIDLWGRIGKAQSAALAEVQASWADLAAARLSVAGLVTRSYFATVEARQQVALAEQSVASYRQSSEQVRRRYQEGVRTSLDVRLSLASQHAAEALLAARRQQLDVATRQLEILLGRYPGASLDGPIELPTIQSPVPGGLPSTLLQRRPDLVAAERRYAAAEARVSEARRAFFPRITLTGSAGTLSDDLADLTDADFSVWSIAAGLTQPIFQGGRLRANLSRSHAVSDQVLFAYVQALLNAFGEVEQALGAERHLADRERALAEAAAQAEAARELAERQYNAGLIDYINVLETQRQALNRRSELLSVRRERLDARVHLHVALGGGFDLSDQWTQFLNDNEKENGGAP